MNELGFELGYCEHTVTAGAYFTHEALLRKCAVQGCAVCRVRRALKRKEYGAAPQHCCFSFIIWLNIKAVFYTRCRTRPSDMHPVAIMFEHGGGT